MEEPTSVGLGGDGDEWFAIRDVERAFGVTLDNADAAGWATAGDVFASVVAKLPPEEASKPETWVRFTKALARETGVDPKKLVPDSPLMGGTRVPWWAIGLFVGAIWVTAYLLGL